MEKQSHSYTEAQARVERIQAFRTEITVLNDEGVLKLSSEQEASIDQYHRTLLDKLTGQFDLDVSTQAKQLSLGMKIASLFGALAMAASLFFLFYQFWGYIATWGQVTILIAAPVILFCITMYLVRKEVSDYFAKIAALVSLACFVLNVSMLGQIFNLAPSPNAFAIWAAFGFLLAYTCNARLLLFFAISCVGCFIAMKIGTWSGMYWVYFGEKPENFFIPGLLFFFLPQFTRHQKFVGFSAIYHVLALIMVFVPILILSNYGRVSYLPWPEYFIEGVYQLLGFALSALAIWRGVKKHQGEVVNTGTVFFVLFLFTKMFDWWWELMPKYLFFFVIGLTSILALMIFKRIRSQVAEQGVAS